MSPYSEIVGNVFIGGVDHGLIQVNQELDLPTLEETFFLLLAQALGFLNAFQV